MKLAIMQPYFFPYIGYFQLINAVDKFVVHDDVQYIRQGWVNRNYILAHHKRYLFVFSVRHDDHTKSFNQRFFASEFEREAKKLLRVIDQAYAKAPHYADARSLLVDVLGSPERNVAGLITQSLGKVCRYLGISTEIIVSSGLTFDKSLTGESRVMAIIKELGGTQYVNSIGGKGLYSKSTFADNGIELSFLKPKLPSYRQYDNEFVPWLSIIDVLMFNPVESVRAMLHEYEVV